MNTTRIGSEYGGKHLDLSLLDKDSVVYSFGLGTDISFDLGLVERVGCNVFGFDPTPKAKLWLESQVLPEQFRYLSLGLSDFDGDLHFSPPPFDHYVSYTPTHNFSSSVVTLPVNRLVTVMKKLGHINLDLLKIDIESAEYSVIDDMIKTRILPRQFLVEFHGNEILYGPYVKKLENEDYVVAAKELTDFTFIRGA